MNPPLIHSRVTGVIEAMTSDSNNPEAIRRDLQRWRDMLKRDTLEADARRALHELIGDAEKRLAEIERRAEATR